MSMILTTTFSMGMLELPSTARFTEIPRAVLEHLDIESHINNEQQSHLLAKFLGVDIEDMPVDRRPVLLRKGESLVYASLQNRSGARINSVKECEEMRPGAEYSYKFILVEVV